MTRILATFVWLAMVWVGFALPAGAVSPKKAASPQTSTVIDINCASVEDFSRLPGIGPKLAQQIVAYRARQGSFHRVEDLMIIKGIGSKKWEALRPFVCVGCPAAMKR